MATQPRLLPLPDAPARPGSNREVGRRGLAKARAALAESVARSAADRLGDGHAAAA